MILSRVHACILVTRYSLTLPAIDGSLRTVTREKSEFFDAASVDTRSTRDLTFLLALLFNLALIRDLEGIYTRFILYSDFLSLRFLCRNS